MIRELNRNLGTYAISSTLVCNLSGKLPTTINSFTKNTLHLACPNYFANTYPTNDLRKSKCNFSNWEFITNIYLSTAFLFFLRISRNFHYHYSFTSLDQVNCMN